MIEVTATTKKITPTKQRTIQIITPFIVSEYGTLGFLAPRRCAKPNNKVNQLTNSEKMRITIFTKKGAFIAGNFIIIEFK